MYRYFSFFALFFTCRLGALYVGNPALPDMIEEGFFFIKENKVALKLGYERDWVFDRSMKLVTRLKGRLDSFESFSDQGAIALNLFDRFEIYGRAGAISFCALDRPVSGLQTRYQTYQELIFGVGARALLSVWENCFLGMDVNYQHADPDIKSLVVNGTPISPRSNSKITFSEWQISLGFGYKISLFYPYIALKYASARASFKHLPADFLSGITHFRAKNRRKFGLALGVSLSTGSRFAFSIESRVIDERAITLAAQIKL